MPRLRTSWGPDAPPPPDLVTPRDDLVLEHAEADGTFSLAGGPFTSYRRTIERDLEADTVVETIDYHLAIPWFGFLFWWPIRRALRSWRRTDGRQPWWAPPDRLDDRQAAVLGLLGAASVVAGFLNTLFTQTSTFAADDFGIAKHGLGIAGTFVRLGIVLALPLVFMADRIGRRRTVAFAAFSAPIVAAFGAIAPNFVLLTATQSIARPLGLALDLLIAVVAAEEMPRSSRAYAVSILAMASGLGAGICVMALPLADIGSHGWRFVYLVPLVFLVFARDLSRRLPETKRFQAAHATHIGLPRKRFTVLAASALIGNFFVAPASFFQNNYLDRVRGYSAGRISLFTLATQTPAGIGLVIGGKLADVRGRRVMAAAGLLFSTSFVVSSFQFGGAVMWSGAFLGGLVGGVAYPALAVYRTELFPTGRRSWAGGLITAAALIGGSGGLLLAGALLDHHGYGPVMGSLALCEVIVAVIVITTYPETAHRELEELNPEDQTATTP